MSWVSCASQQIYFFKSERIRWLNLHVEQKQKHCDRTFPLCIWRGYIWGDFGVDKSETQQWNWLFLIGFSIFQDISKIWSYVMSLKVVTTRLGLCILWMFIMQLFMSFFGFKNAIKGLVYFIYACFIIFLNFNTYIICLLIFRYKPQKCKLSSLR